MMAKFRFFLITVIFFIIIVITAKAEESLTITTYYPSPYGSYRELRAQKVAIGDNYINGGTYSWDTGSIDAAADLVAEGNVGIGTTSPVTRLHILNSGGGTGWPNSSGNTQSAGHRIRFDGANAVLDIGVHNTGSWWMQVTDSADLSSIYNLVLNPNGGNVGIGTANPQARLQVTGGGLCVGSNANCNLDNNTEGVVYSGSTSMTVYDVAENFPTKANLEELTEGTLLVLDPENSVFVKRSSKPYDSLVAGVVSLEPAVLLGGFNGKQFKNETHVAVALAGRVPVKVTTKNGNISIGDLLTTSDIPGTAMKCDENCKIGMIVGKALENFNSKDKEGKILVLIIS